MGYLTTTTGLVLFFLLFELSGGRDFVPDSARMAKASTPDQEMLQNAAFVQNDVAATNVQPIDNPLFTPQMKVYQVTYESDAAFEDIISTRSVPMSEPLPNAAYSTEDLQMIVGDWVNLREGPGTRYNVIDSYPYGTRAEVIQVTDNDWAEIRLPDENTTGWMASWLLSD